MSMPPPPPGSPPPPPPPGFPPGPGAGYYAAPAAAPKNNGLAVAGFVLSLVGIIPCFWAFQLPGLLGVIFSAIGRSQIRRSGGTQKGGGLATAGLVIGILLLVVAVVFVVAIVASDGSFEFGNTDFDD